VECRPYSPTARRVIDGEAAPEGGPASGATGPDAATRLVRGSDHDQPRAEPEPTEGRASGSGKRRGGSTSPAWACEELRPGDELFGFRLVRPLGEGAFASVFLAEQAELADRPVVVKVSRIEGREPQTLAQLRHGNIVPIHSVHEDAERGVRAVCMPYLGGASFGDVLLALFARDKKPLHGRQLVAALEAVQATPLEAPDPEGGGAGRGAGETPLQLLRRLDYPRAVAWLVSRLAEGLQHAHDRGVLHRDIKPSNVLLASDGQPLLLDFNVAQDLRAGREGGIGGTIAYMAPEHLQAIQKHGADRGRCVDERSDVYSLGLVLFEALAGHRAFAQSVNYSVLPYVVGAMVEERSRCAPSVRASRGDVPWGLESIVRKCLSPDAAARYQRASDLAVDLSRWVEDLPLRFAPELSRAERLRKWARRHPRLTSTGVVALLALLLVAACASGIVAARARLAAAREQLAVSEAQDRKQAFEAQAQEARCLLHTMVDHQDNLRQGIAVCRQALGTYGLLDGEVRPGVWGRSAPKTSDHPDWELLGAGGRSQVAEDARELLLLLAGAQVRQAPLSGADSSAPRREALREALALLDRAEAIEGLGPSKALWQDRAEYLAALGEAARARAAQEEADRLEARTARDYYQLAGALARRGGEANLRRAIAALDRALDLSPRHYWSWVLRGVCRQELGESLLAAFDLGAAVGIWPESVWGHFNHGYALDHAGQHREAVQRYGMALKCDPAFVPALINRGMDYLKLGSPQEARRDFEEALRLGKDEAAVHAGLGMALEALGDAEGASRAFRRAFARGGSLPASVAAQLYCACGFSLAGRSPEKAREAFAEALRREGRNPQALYGLGMLAMAEGELAAARRSFDRAVAADPEFAAARRYRAIVLARLGEAGPARADVEWCLARRPGVWGRSAPNDAERGESLYAAACVAALAASRRGADSSAPLGGAAVAEAIDLLEQAARAGVGMERAAKDPDLAALRPHARFRALLP
jgi:serine/threonine protein kinase/Tfp pilus assembly protein PilF